MAAAITFAPDCGLCAAPLRSIADRRATWYLPKGMRRKGGSLLLVLLVGSLILLAGLMLGTLSTMSLNVAERAKITRQSEGVARAAVADVLAQLDTLQAVPNDVLAKPVLDAATLLTALPCWRLAPAKAAACRFPAPRASRSTTISRGTPSTTSTAINWCKAVSTYRHNRECRRSRLISSSIRRWRPGRAARGRHRPPLALCAVQQMGQIGIDRRRFRATSSATRWRWSHPLYLNLPGPAR